MRIIKFGGTSLRDASKMETVVKIIQSYSEPLVVVLSATAGTTDSLLKMVKLSSLGEMEKLSQERQNLEEKHFTIIKNLGMEGESLLKKEIKEYFVKIEIFLLGIYYLREITPRASDAIVSHGELLSTKIFAAYLKFLNIKSEWFDIRHIMKTDSKFGSALPNQVLLCSLSKKLLTPHLTSKNIIVTQGFIGSDSDGLTTTLGRGGSDYTAALLGNALGAELIEIWTDVSGVMTADPRLVPAAFTQNDLSFKEAAELAYFGAKVLHPSTMLPAIEKKIPVAVKNTLQPAASGTTITPESNRPGICKAIAFRKDIMILTVESSRMLMAYGFLDRIFNVFARYQISVDLISTSEISVSLTIDNAHFNPEIVEELSIFSKVRIAENKAIVAVVGENIKASTNFLSKAFLALKDISIEMITFGTSNVNLSLVVPEEQVEESVQKLHHAFFENQHEETSL
jgi:aspartate kinase